MDHIEARNARVALIAAVMVTRDPAQWLLAVRTIVERMGLNTAKCIPIGVTLEHVAFAVIMEAKARGKTAAQVAAALE